MTGLPVLLRLHLRTRWKSLLLTMFGLAALVLSTAQGIRKLYPTLADRQQYDLTLGVSPATAALNGRGYDLHTLGGITAYEVGFMGQLLIPLVGILLAVSLTRGQEEQGRTELLTAGRISALAPWAAATVVLVLMFLSFVGLTTGGLTALHLPAAGSVRYALILGLFGLAWAGVGLLLGQLCQGARTANALGLTITLASYLARAVVDGRRAETPWVSPHAWVAESRPWGTEAQWWPGLALLLLLAMTACAAALLAHGRDLGDGVIGRSRGPAESARLASPALLAWRLTRGAAFGWLLAAVVWAAALGSLAEEMQRLVRSNPTLAQALGVSDPAKLTATFALVLVAVMACATAVSGLQRLGTEERTGRLALALAGRFNRLRLWLGWMAVVAAQAVVTLLLGSLALGLTESFVRDDGPSWTISIVDGLSYLPAVLEVFAGCALFLAVSTRLVGLGWLAVGWATLVALLGETLDLPQWARNLSPLDHVGLVPMVDIHTAGTLILGLSAVVTLLLAGWRFRARDLAAG